MLCAKIVTKLNEDEGLIVIAVIEGEGETEKNRSYKISPLVESLYSILLVKIRNVCRE